MERRNFAASFALWAALVGPTGVHADDSVANFYRGKTFTMVIGSTTGGGYDSYARLVARHIGKHIPGNPIVNTQNMPGASSSVAAAYMYNIAPKDGLAMAAVTPGALMEPLLSEKPSKFDSSKFGYVGSATKDVYVCMVRNDAPVQKFEDIFKTELIVGGAAEGGSTTDFPNFLDHLLGAKFKVVKGYPGNADILVAVDRNEVQGACGNSYGNILHLRPSWFKPDGAAHVLVQEGMEGDPALTSMDVPLAISFAKTEEQRQILGLLYSELQYSRPFLMPPGTPSERLAAIRKAFEETTRDPDYIEDARKLNVEIQGPMTGPELEAIVAKSFAMPSDIVEKARRALLP